ncbi:MAG: hypothetical protein JNG84_08445 [Archangium sp.]|nr:hypothetical protein [Archangium sp.]
MIRRIAPYLMVALCLAGCGATSAECGPSTCAEGCCSSSGECVTGDVTSACGAGGNLCNVCVGAQVCTARVCTLPELRIDAGTEDAGVVDPNAISAAPEVWTWVAFPDAVCGNGQPTGIGVNPSTRSTDVFVYLQGGGACWEGLTCFTLGTADNIETGYGATDFASDFTKSAPGFNRLLNANPLRDASYVFVPYCTGDVHAGDAVRTYSTQQGTRMVHFKGGKNMEAYLRRLKATFPAARRIFLSGSSAGAFGAQLNYQRVVDAFPGAEVHVLADSGQMINPRGTRLDDWVAAWNIAIPASCTTCAANFPAYVTWLTSTFPTRRFALLAYSQDAVLRQFFDYQPAEYQVQTEALLAQQYDGQANARYFYLAGDSHTMLGNLSLASPSGEKLSDFLGAFVRGDASWANVHP